MTDIKSVIRAVLDARRAQAAVVAADAAGGDGLEPRARLIDALIRSHGADPDGLAARLADFIRSRPDGLTTEAVDSLAAAMDVTSDGRSVRG